MSQIIFLNVDLEVESREPLDPLVKALGDDVLVMYNGACRGHFLAAFELATGDGGGVEETMDRFCSLLEHLGKRGRAAWRGAMIRTFDIGFESGTEPSHFRAIIHPATMKRIAKLDAALIVTIYPPWSGPNTPA